MSESNQLKEDLGKKFEQVKSLEGDVRRLNSVVARIHDEKEQQREQHVEKISKMELEKLQLGVDIDQLRDHKRKMAADLDEKKQTIAGQKMLILNEQAGQEKLKMQLTKMKEELESRENAILEVQRQVEDNASSAEKDIEAHVANLDKSRSMIQKQAEHISGLESELSDRDEQISELKDQQQQQEEQMQELRGEFDAQKDKYDELVSQMPMRVRAKIFKPVLGGRERALKEKIDLGGVIKSLKRVGRRSMIGPGKPPPPPPKESAGDAE